ncbi:MAG: hypothetical protein R6V12_15865 [Candidatus Hydrogenedentota bacterium]
MSIRREEDDPEVTKYLKATRATAEKVVEILHEKTYYCPPVTSANSNIKVSHFEGLSRILCGHALYAAKQEESEKATQFVLSGLRLGSAVAKDGPFESVHTGTDIIVQTAICAMCLPWEEYPEEHLRAFLKTLDELRPADIDLSRSLDWEFRLVEAGIFDNEVREDTGGLMASLRETVVRRFLRKHEAELRAVAKLSYPEKEDRSDRHRQLRRTERRVLPTRIVSPLMSGVTSVATASTHVEGLRAVVALERYKKTHGEYPESLDALTPEFLGSVPRDAYSTEPLRYSRKKDSYQLCSVGRDGNNDNGDPKRDIPFPPASAERFKASLKNAEG